MDEEKIIFSKFDENKQFEKGDVFKPIMGTLQRFFENMIQIKISELLQQKCWTK